MASITETGDSSSTPTSISSISLASFLWKYDAFMSFRGTETRRGFAGHLYDALKNKTIEVFKDDVQLKKGTPIRPELLAAIEQSRFALVVFSPDYASSDWCLDELVKIHETMQEKTIIPIFYNVQPSEVRKQTGTFSESFKEHEKVGEFEVDKVRRWKEALTAVSNYAGWNLAGYSDEAECIRKIVERLYKQLVCAGCNDRVGDGALECLNALWHHQCLRCKACDHEFTELKFWNCGNQPYHSHCYDELQVHVCNVCKRNIPNNAEAGESDPFWKQRYCPSHVQDDTPSCCSCERLKPSDAKYYVFKDGRTLCHQCKESIVINENRRKSICLEVQKFYKKLFVKIEKIPVRLVGRQEIIDDMKKIEDGDDGINVDQLQLIRALCLLEERSVITGYVCWRKSQVCYEAKEILIWYGLPRIVTGSLLAQQMMSVWLKLNRCHDLSIEVNKGICRYFGYKWLEYISGSKSTTELSEFEKKLCKFRKSKLECDELAMAKKAVKKHGLEMTLKTIRKTGNFPSVESSTTTEAK